MSANGFEHLTLREQLSEGEHFAREIREHLEQGFLPKARDLRKLLRNDDSESNTVTDRTVRSQVARLLESENFSSEVFEKMEQLGTLIDDQVKEIIEVR